MFYPMKFYPVYKDYIWGSRNLEKIGKKLPGGIVAESWEISCHPDGLSIISNGGFTGKTLQSVINQYPYEITGTYDVAFPLLIKFIDANDRLSVQVHPDDEYALANEGESGKNEMWYIIDAKPGATLIYDIKPGVTRSIFEKAVKEGKVEHCLQTIPVKAGDFVNIPAGTVHAVGDGIILAEVQQNSNSTYRIYDYNRTDVSGKKRPLHLKKAMDVINFDLKDRRIHHDGLEYKLSDNGLGTILVANPWFCVEKYVIWGDINQTTNRQFHIYMCIDGKGAITWGADRTTFEKGETFLVPAALENYSISGNFTALKTYVPDLNIDIYNRLNKMGFSKEQINMIVQQDYSK